MKNLKREQKFIVYIIGILTVLSLLFIIIYNVQKYENTNMPQLEYNSEEINKLNNYISSLYENVNETDGMKISYKKHNYNQYISLVFKIDISNTNSNDFTKYIVSVVDKNNLTTLSKEEIASVFNYDLSYVESKIKLQLNKFYEEEIEEYINSNECNFDCYLSSYRNIDNFENFYYLSIEKGKLVAYLKLINSPYDSDIEYFKNLKNPERLVIN